MSEQTHAEPITPFRVLVMVWVALLCATALTVWASTVNLGRLNVWLALSIAVL